MTTSKVVECIPVKSYEYKGEIYWPFRLTLSNGDTGQYSSKSDGGEKVQVGKEIEYTLVEHQKGNKIKLVYAQKSGFQGSGAKGGGGYQKESFNEMMVSIAFSYAKDLYIAGKTQDPGFDGLEGTFKKIYWVLVDFKQGLIETPIAQPAAPPINMAQPEDPQNDPPPQDESDLPF